MDRKQFNRLFSKALCPDVCQAFMHKGDWAIHEVLPILLSVIGPSSVKIATFNISEDSLRPLFFLTEEKKITTLSLLLDTNVKRHKLDMLLFASNITPEIRIDSCHAKLLLVENEKYRFGIAGSANLNQNHRWEAGFYFTSGEHFDYFQEVYSEAYDNGMKYELE